MNFNENFKDRYLFYIDEKSIVYDGEDVIINEVTISRDEYVTQLIIDLYDLETDVTFFVNKIVEYYRNDKFQELQAMWISDTVHKSYNVRLKVNGNKCKWHADKNGLIVIEMIIDPMVEFTCEILKKSRELYKKELNIAVKEKDSFNATTIAKKMRSIAGFIDKVNKQQIQQKIIKELSSQFFFDTSKHKLLLDNKEINTIDNNNIIEVNGFIKPL